MPVGAIFWIIAAAGAAASTNVVNLFSFDNLVSGDDPRPGLVLYTDGSFYGTTADGGPYDLGTAFRMAPDGTVTPLAIFDGTNGASPYGRLVLARDGNFYGTTMNGGVSNYGTIFQMSPAGDLKTIVSLAGTNGQWPSTGLMQASDGNFYGTIDSGGAYGGGTAFKLNSAGALSVLASFDNTNGADPMSGLIQASDGNFYGTARLGGAGGGTVFKITKDGEITTLVSFAGTNGYWPSAPLMQAADGKIYGTTAGFLSQPNGTVFRLTTNGDLSTLAFFNGTNGQTPLAALMQASDGNLYGTTTFGGPRAPPGGPGTVFSIAPDGTFSTVYAFTGTNDGVNSRAALVQASDGNLYGVSSAGGSFNSGNIFRLSLPMAPVLQPPIVGNDTIDLGWSSVSGQTYQVEYATDLTTSVWTPVGSPITATNGSMMTTDLPGSDQQRFYRVNVLP